MQDTDAIIIGSGHNGLVTAAMLAKAGWKVLVLESALTAGGAAKTAEITQPGFHHDLYAANIGLFLGSAFYREYGPELHQRGFQIASSDKPYCNVFPDGDGIAVYQDHDKTDAQFRRHSQKDADAWWQLLDYFKNTSPHFLPLMQMPLPSYHAVKQIWKMSQALGISGSVDLLQMILKSPREFTEYWFENEKVRSLFIPWGFHMDYGPDVSGGATFSFIETAADHFNGLAISQGGIGNLINSIVEMIKHYGGQVLTGQQVDQIIVDKGKAVGVKLAGGQTITAQKAVIANVTPTQIVNKLLNQQDLPSTYFTKAQAYRYGPGTMMMHFALNGSLDWQAGEDFSKFGYVHIGPYTEDIATTYTQAMNGILPNEPMLVVGQQSVADPSRAPEGKQTLWVQVRALPYKPYQDSLGIIKPGRWQEMKQAYGERVINKLAKYAPNIHQQILDYKVLSPEDLMNDNANLVNGDSVSGSHHIDQNYLFRPFSGWSRYRTPIQDLWMVGAATWPGGGLNATSGYLVAKELIK